MISSSKTNSPNFKTARTSVKYPTYVNLTSLSEEQLNERTPSPPLRKKSLSPPQASSKSISSKSTHYTSSSSPNKYLEGKSMQKPSLFESDHFIYYKNRFETYVKANDLDLWHIILNGDFPPVAKNKETQILETIPFEQQDDDLKKKLAKNNEAKMVLYNVLPKKDYERIFMCKTAKDIWQSLLSTHQEESIDSGFARFNTIITSLKALDEESKDLSSLALDELVENLKVHEVVMEKDSKIYNGKKERIKSIGLKAKKESSDDETLTSGSNDEEYAIPVRNFKKFFRRKGKFVRQPREEKKSFRQRDEKKEVLRAIARMTPKTKPTTKLVSFLNPQMSLKITKKNKNFKTKRDLLGKEILELNEKIKQLERSKEIEIACNSCDELKLENAKLKETQVKFDKSANSLREMLNNRKSASCKIGLGIDSDKASTSGTKTMSFVRSSAEMATDGSIIKGHGSTLPGSVSRKDDQKGTEHVFSP
uniref:DUF4219 domain-containing protein/UBN2 domain-containing protein n=1 Tax=Tanacetum cinerariifolium TaxID=118510 RepID=A0A699HG02_TANCI|nr:hypothetical protein [Tanacetum cinerariifolium]GEY01832.1 hypothetical protein [Tanacetum cinerariifolium]